MFSITVNPRDVVAYEKNRVTHYVTEASDIGLRPGAPYPKYIHCTVGNMNSFYRNGTDEFGNVKYNQNFGMTTLTILND